MNAEIEQLMHDVLDGVATAEEKARLEQQLATDPALRERFDELRVMFEALNAVPMVEPPAGMHAELMQNIEDEAGRTRIPGWLTVLADAFRARPVPAFAMTAVTVALVALLLWSATDRSASRIAGVDSPVAGTMAPPAGPLAATLEAGDAGLSITAGRRGDALVVELDGQAPGGAELHVTVGSRDIQCAIEGQGAAIAGIDAGDVTLRLDSGVSARLRITGPGAASESVSVALLTGTGHDTHEFALGPRGEGP